MLHVNFSSQSNRMTAQKLQSLKARITEASHTVATNPSTTGVIQTYHTQTDHYTQQRYKSFSIGMIKSTNILGNINGKIFGQSALVSYYAIAMAKYQIDFTLY